jgi:hypothetical protein
MIAHEFAVFSCPPDSTCVLSGFRWSCRWAHQPQPMVRAVFFIDRRFRGLTALGCFFVLGSLFVIPFFVFCVVVPFCELRVLAMELSLSAAAGPSTATSGAMPSPELLRC